MPWRKALLRQRGRRPLEGVRVGVPAAGDYFRGVPNDDQLAAFDEAAQVIASLGADVVTVSTETLPEPFTTLNSMTTPIVNTEVGAFQYENWKARAEDFTERYRNQVNNGNLLPANAYVDAQRARALWNERFLGHVRGHRRVHSPRGRDRLAEAPRCCTQRGLAHPPGASASRGA